MGRRKLTNAEIETFRQQIMASAERLFASRGYQEVSLRAIAAEVGCSPMTLYRYFDDKEHLFNTIRSQAFSRFAAAQEAAASGHPELMSRVRALGRAYSDFADEEPNAFRLMFELQQSPDANAELKAASERAFRSIRKETAAAIDAGELTGDPDTMAHLFWTSLHGIVTLDMAGKLTHGRSKADLLDAMFSGDR